MDMIQSFVQARIILTVSSLLLLSSISAAEEINYFDTIVVTASRTAERLGDIDSSLTVITDTEIQDHMIDSLEDLFQFSPGISASSERADSINIRGVDGNRVLITVDGVKQPKLLDFGPLQSGRNFIDPTSLKQVEIVRSPASSLYGSDALGGVVAYTTKEPKDLLKKQGDGLGGELILQYNGADEGITRSAQIAGRQGNVESLLIVTQRDAQETDNNGEISTPGPTYEKPNPRDVENTNILAKVNVQINEQNQVKLTAEQAEIDDEFQELRTTTQESHFQDDSKKRRISLQWDTETPNNPLFDKLSTRADWQKTETDSLWSFSFGSPVFSTFRGTYDEEHRALNLAFEKALKTGQIKHQFTYGLNIEKQDYAQWRDSSTTGIARGMPKSEQESIALYLQDQITLNEHWRVTPGVRFDDYKITPQPDEAYLANQPADPDPSTNEDQQTSFKLGVTFDLDEQNSFFAQYAQGFKAPDMDQLYSNFIRPYQITLPNPDLKPESSDSFELGYRFEGQTVGAELVAFYNEYDNFIEEATIAPGNAESPPTVQTQNLAGVEIQGLEIKGQWDINNEIQLRGALAYADGEYERNGKRRPLNSILPLNGRVSLRYTEPHKKWGGEIAVTAASGKKRNDIDAEELATENPLLSNGYGIFDITGYYQLGKNTRFYAGLFNMTDKKYWNWDNLDTVSGQSAGLARTEAGRHAKFSVVWNF